MSFTLISNTGFAPGFSGGTTSAIDTTGATLIVVQESGASLDLSDSKSNTWIPLTARSINGGGTLKLWYCINPTVGSGHTFTTVGIVTTLNIAAFGSSGTVTFDVENGVNAGSSPRSNGSITPGTSDELFVVGLGTEGGPSASIDSGFTITNQEPYVFANNYGGGLAYLISSGFSAQNPAWTVTGGTSVSSTMAAFADTGSTVTIERDFSDTVTFSDALTRNTVFNATALLLFEFLINSTATLTKEATCLITFSFSQIAVPLIEIQGTALIEFDFSLAGAATKIYNGTCEILYEMEWELIGQSNAVPLECISKPEEQPSEIVGNLNVAYFT